MRMGQGVRTGLGHGGITCVLQTQFSSYLLFALNSVAKWKAWWALNQCILYYSMGSCQGSRIICF